MMTQEQVAQTVQTILSDIATIKAKQNTDHARIEENKALIKPLTEQLQRLAVSFEHFANQFKEQNGKIDKLTVAVEDRQKTLGERVGRVEIRMERQDAIDGYMKSDIAKMQQDVAELKAKDSKKYAKIIGIVATAVITGLVMFVLSQVGIY